MIIRFSKSFVLPVETVFGYFASPDGWVQLYDFGGPARALEGGWYAVPLRRFPFPLVARVTVREENALVRWTYRGFWSGEGEVSFSRRYGRTFVSGTEVLSIRRLGAASRLVERLFLERAFMAIWDRGWCRLRRLEAASSPATMEVGA